MIYVLGTQFIVDLSRSADNKASDWIRSLSARNVTYDRVRVSCMSVLAIEQGLEAEKDKEGKLPVELLILKQRIGNVLHYYRERKLILPLHMDSVDLYLRYLMSDIIYDNSTSANPIPLEEKLVLASVIAGCEGQPATLVNPYHTAYDRLQKFLGLRVEDPNV